MNRDSREIAIRMREIIIALQPFKLKGAKKVTFESPPNVIEYEKERGKVTITNPNLPEEDPLEMAESDLWREAHFDHGKKEEAKPDKSSPDGTFA
jgi:hypothetical protein